MASVKPIDFRIGKLRASVPTGAATSSRRMPMLQKYECGIHSLTYEAFSAGCPACSLEREVEQMRKAIQELSGKLEVTVNQNNQLKVQLDIIVAIKEAVLLLNDNDLAFLKTSLYQWRDEKSIMLKTTHGARKKRNEVPQANGFIVMPRRGDPWGYSCTSVGGLAIAQYFDEATNTSGPAEAMKILARGLADQLPGGL